MDKACDSLLQDTERVRAPDLFRNLLQGSFIAVQEAADLVGLFLLNKLFDIALKVLPVFEVIMDF